MITNIAVENVEFDPQSVIKSWKDIYNFIISQHDSVPINNDDLTFSSIPTLTPTQSPPKRKKIKSDPFNKLHLTKIHIQPNQSINSQSSYTKFPIYLSKLDSDNGITIQNGQFWDSPKLCQFQFNLQTLSSQTNPLISLFTELIDNKSKEQSMSSILNAGFQINKSQRSNLQTKLNKLKKSIKDFQFNELQLFINNHDDWYIEFDLILLFKENGYNKFTTSCNQILDNLFITQPQNLHESNHHHHIRKNNNFIQRDFCKQTVQYTNDILSNMDITLFNNNNNNNNTIPNLNVTLLPFQEKSVQWMLNKEKNCLNHHLYTENISNGTISSSSSLLLKFLNEKICFGYIMINESNDILYWNKFTNFIINHDHALLIYHDYLKDSTQLSGAKGLLSDEMGLGKTIEIMALMLLNKRNLSLSSSSSSSSTFVTQDKKIIHKSNSTLIICPNSLLKQWINEIDTHTNQGAIKYFHYQGYHDIIKRFHTTNIKEIINNLQEYDLIITTYKVINLEIHYAQYNANIRSRRKRIDSNGDLIDDTPKYDYSSPLALIQFWRIILDEVQMLKSDNTQIAKCTNMLHRIHTWGVSGTPIQTVRDFQTVLSYLQIYPFVTQNDLILNINNDINQISTKQGIRFQLDDILNLFIKFDLCIRHRKRDVSNQTQLPKQTNYILPLEFNPIEWDNYLHLWNEFISVSGYGPEGQNKTRLNNNQLNQWLLKLRYLCCHAIIPENIANMFNLNNSRGRRGRKRIGDSEVMSGNHNENHLTDQVRNIDDILTLMTTDAVDSVDSLNRENIQLQIWSGQAKMELQNNPMEAIGLLKNVIIKIKTDLKDKFHIDDELGLKLHSMGNVDKIKIRAYLDLLHQCYFFIGTGYYFLGSKKLEIVEEENEKIRLIHEEKDNDDKLILKIFTDFYSEQEIHDIEKMQLIEKEFYERAERLRKQILLERAVKVSDVIKEVQTAFQSDKGNDDNRKLSKKEKTLITDLKLIEFDTEDYSSNQLVSKCFQSMSSMFKYLNKQAEQFNELMVKLTEMMYRPVVKDYDETNEDEKQEEYNNSLEDQDKIFGILHCLEEILKNREIIITSEDESIKLNKKQFLQIDPTYSEYHSELLQNLIIIDKGASLKSVFNDLKNAKIVRSSLNNIKSTDKKFNNFEDYLIEYNKEVPRITKEIKEIRESIKKLNLVYNAKVEYYAQLQKISDSLVSLIQLEPITRNNITKAIRNNKRYKENLVKMSKIESRVKYLQNLTKLKELIESDKSFNCAICLGVIHDGSIIKCGHFFCHDCIHNWLKNKKTCPICKVVTTRAELYNFKFKNKPDLVTVSSVKDETSTIAIENVSKDTNETNVVSVSSEIHVDDGDYLFNGKYEKFPQYDEVSKITIKEHFGAKIDFMIKLILYLKLKAGTENESSPQILIYSQNFEFLKIITKILKLNHISHLSCLSNVRSVGNAIDKFKKDSNITCLLLNVKTLGAGLNLLNAKHIFLLDPIISHNDELQAMNRNYRIGQTQETFVWNFMIRDSVEENIFRYKCILENNKHLIKSTDNLGEEEVELEEEDKDLEISDNSTELVSDKHLWSCFFQQ